MMHSCICSGRRHLTLDKMETGTSGEKNDLTLKVEYTTLTLTLNFSLIILVRLRPNLTEHLPKNGTNKRTVGWSS